MTWEEYFLQYKWSRPLELPKETREVRDQAARHIYRNADNVLLDLLRPTESAAIKEWRKQNRKNISSDIPDLFLSECTNAVKITGFRHSELLKNTSEYLISEKINILGNSLSFDDWFYAIILPSAIADPNAYYCLFPLPTQSGVAKPSEQSSLYPVKIDHRIISSKNIRQLPYDKDGSLFCFETKEVINGQKVAVYYVADESEWFRVVPGETTTIELWYKHDLGFLPAKILPGYLSEADERDPYGNKTLKKYQESILKSTFNYLDEFLSSFDDDKVIRTKSAHPILYVPQLACPECNGQAINKDGKSCGTCSGTGKVLNLTGPASTFVLPSGNDIEKSAMLPGYVSPPTDAIRQSYETTWAFYDKAANTKGIDAIQKVAESGEAMKMRVQKNERAVNEVYQMMCAMYEFAINAIQGYLYPDPNSRKDKIFVYKEIKIDIKTPDILRLKYEDALPIEKQDRALEYFRLVYANEPDKLKKYEVLIKYFPATMSVGKDLGIENALGAFTEEDIAISKYAGEAVELVLSENTNNINKTNLEIYRLAIQKINEIRS